MTRSWPDGASFKVPPVTNEFGTPHGLTVFHRGIDLVGFDPVLAADNGQVIFAAENGTAGYEVTILHDDGYTTRYLHLTPALRVRRGDRVTRGQLLGFMGATGYVTGKHLHFEVIAPDRVTRINPRDYIPAAAPADSGDSKPFPTPGKDTTEVKEPIMANPSMFVTVNFGTQTERDRIWEIFDDPRTGQRVRRHVANTALWAVLQETYKRLYGGVPFWPGSVRPSELDGIAPIWKP